MRWSLPAWPLLALGLLASGAAPATEAFHTDGVTLLQPDWLLRERIPDVEAFSHYLQAIEQAANAALAAEKTPHPGAGFVVVAVRTGGHAKSWLDLQPGLPADVDARLRAAVEAVPPCEIHDGVVVFALNASLWGVPATSGLPVPKEWTAALKAPDESIDIDTLVERVWPEPAPAPADE